MPRPAVSRRATATGWIEFARAPLPSALAGTVAGRCGNAEHAADDVTRTLPASALVPLVISWGDSLDVTVAGGSEGAARHGSFVAGLRAGHTRTRFRGEQGCVQIYLTPLGAHRILGVPGRELADAVLDIEDVAPALAGLSDRLAQMPTWADRLALVDRTLLALALADRGAGDDPLAHQVWDELRTSGGTAPIHAVARRTGMSQRTVGARFGARVGVSPKTAARILRFESTAHAIGRGERLADVAAATGYADQSHMTREFTALAGTTPARWTTTPPPTPRAAFGLPF